MAARTITVEWEADDLLTGEPRKRTALWIRGTRLSTAEYERRMAQAREWVRGRNGKIHTFATYRKARAFLKAEGR